MRTSSPGRTTRLDVLTGGIAAAALALTAAACGSGTPSAAPASSHHAMASHHPMAESAQFGSDCGMVPATGMGSLHGMAMDPAATARIPKRARSDLRSGASAPMPPIWMAIELKLAKPHNA